MPESPDAKLASIYKVIYRLPSITAFNRLEATPRTRDFYRSISAEVRDPLWMLTRQWQFGEFKGEDAGSPINATILATTSTIDRIKLGSDPVALIDGDTPLETHVEKEQQQSSLLVAVQAGRYFLQLLNQKSLQSYRPQFVTKYGLTITDKAEVQEKQFYDLVKDKIPDGVQIVKDIQSGSYSSLISGLADKDALDELGSLLLAWWRRMYAQPDASQAPAWKPQQLEYQFVMADGEGADRTELFADQYYQGHLDWYSFDRRGGSSLGLEDVENNAKAQIIKSFIPSPISFKGMPHPRFWQFEEQTVDFGKIDTSPTGLLHLLFAEFGLIYANDWFMLPYPMNVNTLAEIPGIRVTDVFGQHTYIRPAGKDWNSDWQSWAMFQLNTDGSNDDSNNLFYLPPSLYKSLENEPMEEVYFVRDEMTNMVWAIEDRIPSGFFKGKSGKETALAELPPNDAPPESRENVKYTLGVQVPTNHIPFIPVHLPGNVSEIRLQRARMVNGKQPRGVLLNEKESPYFINEEEIVRSGLSVSRSYQRSRWLKGTTFLWTGRKKRNGHKEAWSGLQFDQIEE